MCLFDLIKQHHTVRAAAHGFGQLSALVMAQITRRRTQQPGSGVLLLILRHIKFEQGFFAAEPADRQRPGKSRFAHSRGAKKQHGTHGPARLAKTGAAAPDGTSHRSHSPALAHDLGVEPLFQLIQPFPLLLAYPLHRHTAGLRHHTGDIVRHQRGL